MAAWTVVLLGCGGEGDPADGTDPKAAPTPRVAVGGSPDSWTGPRIELEVRPNAARTPGSARVRVEVPADGYRLERDASVVDGENLRLELTLEAPAEDGAFDDVPRSVSGEWPVPAGTVRVQVWLRSVRQGVEPVFGGHELAATIVRVR